MKQLAHNLLLLLIVLIHVASAQTNRRPAGAPPRQPPPPPPLRTSYIAELNSQHWREFVSPAGSFAAVFPSQPQELRAPAPTAFGQLETHTSMAQTSAAVYSVSYLDLPVPESVLAGEEAARRALDSGRDQMLRSSSGSRLISERDISLSGNHRGREMVVETASSMLQMRCYIVNRRVYQVMVIRGRNPNASPTNSSPTTSATREANAFDAAMTRFLDSFRLTVSVAPSRSPDAGQIERGAEGETFYLNRFFGLRVRLPPHWRIHDRGVEQLIRERAGDVVSSPDPERSAGMNAAVDRTRLLLFASPAATSDSSAAPPRVPLLMCMAELILPSTPRITTGREFITRAERDLRAMSTRIEMTSAGGIEVVAGLDFDVMEIMPDPQRTPGLKQRYLVRIMRGYALTFALTYRTAEELDELRAVLRGVSFERR